MNAEEINKLQAIKVSAFERNMSLAWIHKHWKADASFVAPYFRGKKKTLKRMATDLSRMKKYYACQQ